MADKSVPACKSCRKRDAIEVHRDKDTGQDVYYCTRCERVRR